MTLTTGFEPLDQALRKNLSWRRLVLMAIGAGLTWWFWDVPGDVKDAVRAIPDIRANQIVTHRNLEANTAEIARLRIEIAAAYSERDAARDLAVIQRDLDRHQQQIDRNTQWLDRLEGLTP